MHVDTGLVRAHGIAALATLLVSVTFGLIISIQLWWPDLGAGVPALSWGRLRYAHTQGIMLGWLANAFFAFLYHAVPRLTGRPVTSPALGRWLFGIWNLAVMVPGWVLVLAGVWILFGDEIELELNLGQIWPIAAVAIGMLLVLAAFIPRGDD